MKIEPFEVEQWMDEYETQCRYNIAETCCASLALTSLLSLSPNPPSPLTLLDTTTPQNYGHIRGHPALRQNIAALYPSSDPGDAPLAPENVLVTAGAIAANFLVLYTLVGPGDHVICHHPTYQQLYSVPEALGAEVELWKARAEKGWVPDIEELEALVRPETKLIIIKYCGPFSVTLTPRPFYPNQPTAKPFTTDTLTSARGKTATQTTPPAPPSQPPSCKH